MTNTILELHEIRRVFPGFELGPVTLQLRAGQIYGLLGPNGAGKTTLLDVMALQRRATTGSLRAGGHELSWGDTAWKAQLSYLREEPSFYAELTVAQTLKLASRLYPRWDSELARHFSDRLRLPLSRRVAQLSKGTRVKLGIVAALAHRATLLILDEPTAGLDPGARRQLHDLLQMLRQEHPAVCVVLSSHLFEDLEAVPTDIVILRHGRLALRVSSQTLRTSVLFRSTRPREVAASPDLVLRWRRHDAEWLMVKQDSPLERDLRTQPDHVVPQPGHLLAALYDGTEPLDED